MDQENDSRPAEQLWGHGARFWLTVLLILAAGLKLVYLLQALPTPEIRLYNELYSTDSAFFLQWAENIRSGDIWTDRSIHPHHDWHKAIAPVETWEDWFRGKCFHQEPLYPYLLALVLSLTGSPLGMLVFQGGMSILSMALLFGLARRYAGLPVAIISSLLYLGYGPFYVYESQLLRTTLLVCLGLAGILMVERMRSERSFLSGLFAGLVLGLLLVAKTSNALFVIAVFAIILLSRGRGPWRWKSSVAVALGVLLCLVAPMARNLKVGAPLLSMSSVAAQTFIGGNAPDATGYCWIVSRHHARIMRESRGEISQVVVLTLKEYRGNPWAYARLLGRKAYAVLNGWEQPDNVNYYQARRHVPLLRFLPFNFYMLCPLGLLGIWLSRKNLPQHLVALAFLVTGIVPLLIFYMSSRFRLPLVPLFCLYAGITLNDMARRVKQNRKSAALMVLLLFILAFLLNLPGRDLQRIRPQDYMYAASQYEKLNQPEASLAEFEQCIKEFPEYTRAYLQFAEMLIQADNSRRAIDVLKDCISANPAAAYCGNSLGMLYLDRKNYRDAIDVFSRAYSDMPDDQDIRYNLCLAYHLARETRPDKICDGFIP